MIETELRERYGRLWTTSELQKEFTVLGFCNCYVVVIRKSDNQKGSLDFEHRPRFYHSWVPDNS